MKNQLNHFIFFLNTIYPEYYQHNQYEIINSVYILSYTKSPKSSIILYLLFTTHTSADYHAHQALRRHMC